MSLLTKTQRETVRNRCQRARSGAVSAASGGDADEGMRALERLAELGSFELLNALDTLDAKDAELERLQGDPVQTLVLMRTGYYESFPDEFDEDSPIIEGSYPVEREGEMFWAMEIERESFLDFIEENTPRGYWALTSVEDEHTVTVTFLCSVV